MEHRRGLYSNIVFAGGSICFKDFSKRVSRDLKRIVWEREREQQIVSGTPIEITTVSHHFQPFAAWFGGSMLGTTPEAEGIAVKRDDYEEHGPSLFAFPSLFQNAYT